MTMDKIGLEQMQEVISDWNQCPQGRLLLALAELKTENESLKKHIAELEADKDGLEDSATTHHRLQLRAQQECEDLRKQLQAHSQDSRDPLPGDSDVLRDIYYGTGGLCQLHDTLEAARDAAAPYTREVLSVLKDIRALLENRATPQ